MEIFIKSIFTARKRSFEKLVLLLSVILFTGGLTFPQCHGTGRHPNPHPSPPEAPPPHLRRQASTQIRSTGGRYASYCNAYLFQERRTWSDVSTVTEVCVTGSMRTTPSLSMRDGSQTAPSSEGLEVLKSS